MRKKRLNVNYTTSLRDVAVVGDSLMSKSRRDVNITILSQISRETVLLATFT